MAKRGAKRRQCREASVLDRVPDHSKASLGAGLPRAIPLPIPTYWTPEQAIAVFELVDDQTHREAIPTRYIKEMIRILTERDVAWPKSVASEWF
jgi:hypothetical protein